MSIFQKVSDSELFELISEDDHGAYKELYYRYSRLLYTHAYKKLGEREVARDTVQDLFTTIWLKRHDMRIKSAPQAYLYTALRNMILELFDRQKVATNYLNFLEHYPTPLSQTTDHLIREKQLSEMIVEEIAALPEKMRIVFQMSRHSHFSHKEIALKLGISEQTVRKQIQYALKILRPKLGMLIYFLFIFEK